MKLAPLLLDHDLTKGTYTVLGNTATLAADTDWTLIQTMGCWRTAG